MPGDKDSTLRDILDTLGMTTQATSPMPRLDNGSSMRPPSATQHDQQPFLNSAITPPETSSESFGGKDPNQQGVASLIEAEPGDCLQGHFGSGLLSISSNESSMVSLEEYHTELTDNSPGSEFNSWLFDLDFGTHITPVATDTQPALSSSVEDGLRMPPVDTQIQVKAAHSEMEPTLLEGPASTSDIEGLVEELSDRVGTLRIGPGGKTRFCGPTSTFNLADIALSDSHEATPVNPAYISGFEEEIPAELENHLLNLYFTWQDPSIHVVDREVYEDARKKWINREETAFYSEALRNAM